MQKNRLVKIIVLALIVLALIIVPIVIGVISFRESTDNIQKKFEVTCESMVSMYVELRTEYESLKESTVEEDVVRMKVLKFQFNKVSACYEHYLNEMIYKYPMLDTTTVLMELPRVE